MSLVKNNRTRRRISTLEHQNYRFKELLNYVIEMKTLEGYSASFHPLDHKQYKLMNIFIKEQIKSELCAESDPGQNPNLTEEQENIKKRLQQLEKDNEDLRSKLDSTIEQLRLELDTQMGDTILVKGSGSIKHPSRNKIKQTFDKLLKNLHLVEHPGEQHTLNGSKLDQVRDFSLQSEKSSQVEDGVITIKPPEDSESLERKVYDLELERSQILTEVKRILEDSLKNLTDEYQKVQNKINTVIKQAKGMQNKINSSVDTKGCKVKDSNIVDEDEEKFLRTLEFNDNEQFCVTNPSQCRIEGDVCCIL